MHRFALMALIAMPAFATTPEDIIATADAFDSDIYAATLSFAEKCQGMQISEGDSPLVQAMKEMVLGPMVRIAKERAPDLTICTPEDLANVRAASACTRDVAIKNFEDGSCAMPQIQQNEDCHKLQEVSSDCKSAFTNLLLQHRTEL